LGLGVPTGRFSVTETWMSTPNGAIVWWLPPLMNGGRASRADGRFLSAGDLAIDCLADPPPAASTPVIETTIFMLLL
jgi:hypothetical protein